MPTYPSVVDTRSRALVVQREIAGLGAAGRLRFPHAQPFGHAIFNMAFNGLCPHGFPAEKQSFPAYSLNDSYTIPLRLVLVWSTTGYESSVAAKDRRDVAQPYAYWTTSLSWDPVPEGSFSRQVARTFDAFLDEDIIMS